MTTTLVQKADLTTEELALKSQWETFASTGFLDNSVAELNAFLRDATYVVGTKPTEADSVVYKALISKITGWTKSVEDLTAYRHIIRWADLVETDLLDKKTLKLDYDVVLPREIKEKKKKGSKEAPKEAPKEAAKAPAKEEPKKEGNKGKKPKQGKPDEATIARQRAAKEAKKAKKAKQAQQQQQATRAPPAPSMIDFRVGFIQKAVKHPDADSLYVSTIDMGDKEGPRTVCSGLVKYIPLEDMQQRYVVVVANLKPVKMRGIKSSAMVFCASIKNDESEVVEFVNPPEGSQPGDKIFFEGFDGEPEHVLTPKKKIWETCQPKFTTSKDLDVVYQDEGKTARLVNAKGELCKVKKLVGAAVR